MTRLMMAMLGLGCLAGTGCFSRAHMTDTYGRAYKTAFARQAVNVGASNARTPKGLDALEATIVVETYRTQLSPRAAGFDQQMIMVSPQAGGLGYSPYTPPSAPPPAK
jgi:hypothetical protein